jgi:fructosamine-3-kinase
MASEYHHLVSAAQSFSKALQKTVQSWCAGFGQQFWDGYRSLIPEDEGFLDRKPLYDAYHQLNHYNLFGGGYLGSARGHLENLKRKLDAKAK